MGFLDSLKQAITGKKDTGKYLSGFAKTNNALGRKLKFITENNTKNKEDFVEQLMITLIESDIGYKTSEDICDRFFKETQDYLYLRQEDVMDILLETFDDIYNEKKENEIVYNDDGPTVILMVGVNGSGKTTTSAKLIQYYKEQGKKVAVAAADTFRAGAIDQIDTWATRLGVHCVKGKMNQDPSSVLVDACRYAKENDIDILICDTAGRLQNKTNLMNELSKMHRVVQREIEGAPQEVWLVLDATTGQNGISQAKVFLEATDVTGIVLTKMDGTAKGGVVLAIRDLLHLPVRFLGLGEKPADLRPFDINAFLMGITKGMEE